MFQIFKNLKAKYKKADDSWDEAKMKVIREKIERSEKSMYKYAKPLEEIVCDLDEEISEEVQKYHSNDKEKADKLKNRLIDVLRITCLKDHKSNSMRENLQFIFDLAWEEEKQDSIYLRNKMYPAGKPTVEKFIADLAKSENEEMEEEECVFWGALDAVRLEGQTVDDLYKSMKKQIDDMWKNTDLNAVKRRNELFPNGKPSVQEFLETFVNLRRNVEKAGG